MQVNNEKQNQIIFDFKLDFRRLVQNFNATATNIEYCQSKSQIPYCKSTLDDAHNCSILPTIERDERRDRKIGVEVGR